MRVSSSPNFYASVLQSQSQSTDKAGDMSRVSAKMSFRSLPEFVPVETPIALTAELKDKITTHQYSDPAKVTVFVGNKAYTYVLSYTGYVLQS